MYKLAAMAPVGDNAIQITVERRAWYRHLLLDIYRHTGRSEHRTEI